MTTNRQKGSLQRPMVLKLVTTLTIPQTISNRHKQRENDHERAIFLYQMGPDWVCNWMAYRLCYRHLHTLKGDIMNDNELHGDEHLLDANDYPPVEQWEIDEALADIKADLQWLEAYSE